MTVFECSKKMQKCVEEGNMRMAEKWFGLMRTECEGPDAVAYTILMKGYCEANNDKRVFDLFDEMIAEKIEPNDRVLNVLINACAIAADVSKAEYLYSMLENDYGISPNVHTFGRLLKVCSKAGDVTKARTMYEEMRERGIRGDVITLTTLFNVFAGVTDHDNGEGYLKECKSLLETMQKENIQPNCMTYNSLIKICARAGLTEEAFEVLEIMENSGVPPNSFTYNMLIDGCIKSADLSAQQVLSRVGKIREQMKMQQFTPCGATYTSLFGVCLKIGDLQRAQQYYAEAKKLRVKLSCDTYGALIKCYAKLGDPTNRDTYLNPCFELVEDMENRRLRMSVRGYTSLISACANAKDIRSALEFWKKMKRERVILNTAACGAMIKALVCVDDIDAAIGLLNEMKAINVRPNSIIFFMLFSKCEKNKEVSKARLLRDKMLSYNIRPDQTLRDLLTRMNLL